MTEKGQSSSTNFRQTITLEGNVPSRLGGALIGHIKASKDFHRGTIQAMVQKNWNLTGEVEILDIARNIFVFQFSERNDYYRILRGRPWSFQSFLVNLQLWDDDMVLREVCFDNYPIWIQFHGLPFKFLNQSNAIKLGNSVGKVVMVENPVQNDKLIRNFLRARVLIDTKKPLITGCWVSRENKGDIWTEVRYERLPNFCYHCGLIGHEQRTCTNMGADLEDETSYGSWMKITNPKYMEEILIPVVADWCEIRCKSKTVARRLNFPNTHASSEKTQEGGRDSWSGGNNDLDCQQVYSQTETTSRGNVPVGERKANKSKCTQSQERTESMEESKRGNQSPIVEQNLAIIVKDTNQIKEIAVSDCAKNVVKSTQLSPSKKIQFPLPVRSPMKQFYKKQICASQSQTLMGSFKKAGGRTGQVISLGTANEVSSGMSTSLPPASPLLEVAGRLGVIKIRRTPPTVDSPRCSKKRKEEIPLLVEPYNAGSADVDLQSSKKRNVRRTKQLLRQRMAVDVSNSSTFAEGSSGWPETALSAP